MSATSATSATLATSAPSVPAAPNAPIFPGTWRSGARQSALKALPGLALATAVAAAAMGLGTLGWARASGVSALTLAIVLGMVIGNTAYGRIAHASAPGVSLAKQKVLRLGIVLYGLRVTFQDIGHFGLAGLLIDTLVLGSTFALSCFLGVRLLGLERNTAMLIGAGSSICGAAAVMATEPVLRCRAEQVTVAVATVVVFGTVSIFLYPLMYHWNEVHRLIPLTHQAYGVYAGSTIHEVAQVVAAGRAIDLQAANAAVIAKMVRVMLLAPFLVALSVYLSRAEARKAAPVQGLSNSALVPGSANSAPMQRSASAPAQGSASAPAQGSASASVQGSASASVQGSASASVQGSTTSASVQASASAAPAARGGITIPWFALGFIAVAGFNSLALLPAPVAAVIVDIDTVLLAAAMAALGLTTHVSAIRNAGVKPLLLAAMLFAWLLCGGAAINLAIGHWLG